MNKTKNKIHINILFGLLILLTTSIVYNVYDNHRFIVVEQEIIVERLPQSFDDFRILHISDLHGKYFGEKQADLIEAINKLDYDMIAFTGDMNNSTEMDHSVENSKAILDLLDGIKNKDYMFWVDGNTGPYAIEHYDGMTTGGLTEIGAVLQEKGCKLLTLPHAITRGNDKIWITPEMSEMSFSWARSRLENEKLPEGDENAAEVQFFYQQAYESFQALNGNREVKIFLSHSPKQINLTAEELKMYGDELDYDLILAGHYHGGQIRLPLIGAFYIPSPTTGINNSGFFPDQSAVKGISYYGNVPQYVSAGLGASGHVRMLSFRLFNTSEINLITLRR